MKTNLELAYDQVKKELAEVEANYEECWKKYGAMDFRTREAYGESLGLHYALGALECALKYEREGK